MKKMLIVYRTCSSELTKETHRPCRPPGFDKTKNWMSILQKEGKVKEKSFEYDIALVIDGKNDISDLFPNCSTENNTKILLGDDFGNERSYRRCLEYAYSKRDLYDYVYFIEDDYYHKEGWDIILASGLRLAHTSCLVSLYDHPDRYFRTDDQCENGIYLGEYCHWRLAESTTCTWAASMRVFEDVYHDALEFGIKDRDFFRNITKGLITPLPGWSTHLHTPYISPFFNLEKHLGS